MRLLLTAYCGFALCSTGQADTLLSAAKTLGQHGMAQQVQACPLERQAAEPNGPCWIGAPTEVVPLAYRAVAKPGPSSVPFGQNTSFGKNSYFGQNTRFGRNGGLGQNRLFGKP